jgi:hypothetical protein
MFTKLVRTIVVAAAVSFAAFTGVAFADGGTHADLMRVRAAMAPAWCPEADYKDVAAFRAAAFESIGVAPQGPADDLTTAGTSFEEDHCVTFLSRGEDTIAIAAWKPTPVNTDIKNLDLCDGQEVQVVTTSKGTFLVETISFQIDRKEMIFNPIGVHGDLPINVDDY